MSISEVIFVKKNFLVIYFLYNMYTKKKLNQLNQLYNHFSKDDAKLQRQKLCQKYFIY
jgi:hypothetical protein